MLYDILFDEISNNLDNHIVESDVIKTSGRISGPCASYRP